MAFISILSFKKAKYNPNIFRRTLTGADCCVVAGPVLAQGSGALGGEGGSSTDASAALPALPTGD